MRRLYAGLIDPEHPAEHALPPGRRAYLHVARGAASLNGLALAAGDGARIESETGFTWNLKVPQKYCCSIWPDN